MSRLHRGVQGRARGAARRQPHLGEVHREGDLSEHGATLLRHAVQPLRGRPLRGDLPGDGPVYPERRHRRFRSPAMHRVQGLHAGLSLRRAVHRSGHPYGGQVQLLRPPGGYRPRARLRERLPRARHHLRRHGRRFDGNRPIAREGTGDGAQGRKGHETAPVLYRRRRGLADARGNRHVRQLHVEFPVRGRRALRPVRGRTDRPVRPGGHGTAAWRGRAGCGGWRRWLEWTGCGGGRNRAGRQGFSVRQRGRQRRRGAPGLRRPGQGRPLGQRRGGLRMDQGRLGGGLPVPVRRIRPRSYRRSIPRLDRRDGRHDLSTGHDDPAGRRPDATQTLSLRAASSPMEVLAGPRRLRLDPLRPGAHAVGGGHAHRPDRSGGGHRMVHGRAGGRHGGIHGLSLRPGQGTGFLAEPDAGPAHAAPRGACRRGGVRRGLVVCCVR